MENTDVQSREPPRGVTFEDVWASIQETARQMQETDRRIAETDRQLKETGKRLRELGEAADKRQGETARQIAETSREIKKLQEETSREIKELSKNVGGLNNSLGKWAEEIISANLWEKFNELGYAFTRGVKYKYLRGRWAICEVDALLENGDYVMPVEIKSVLSKHDVDEHLERIEKVRKELDEIGDHRKLVGAVAGMVVEDGVGRYAQDKGLYVLVQSGESVKIAEMEETFQAREW